MVKNPPTMQETLVPPLGWDDPLEEGMATHSSILTWTIPMTEEPGSYSLWRCKESDTPEQLKHITAQISSGRTYTTVLHARLQQYMNQELPDFQAGFRKGRGTRDQWPTSIRPQKKQGDSRKTSISASLTMLRPLTVWTTTNCGIFIKREEYQTSLSA